MKQFIICAGLLFAACLTSCYKDKSTHGEVKGRITVDFDSDDIIDIRYSDLGPVEQQISLINGAMLALSPIIIKEGDAHPDLSYLWELSITADNLRETNFSILGNEKDVSWVVTRAPNTEPYTLRYTVTDNATGIASVNKLKIMVGSSAGDGIIVADTRDGATSDLTLVRNKYISNNYTKETSYKRDAYSQTNGAKYDGVITDMLYVEVGIYGIFKYYIFAMSEENIESLTSETYSVAQDRDAMFILPPSHGGKFTALRINSWGVLAVYGSDLYKATTMIAGTTAQFGDPANYVNPANIANKRHVNRYYGYGPDINSFFIDETNGRMYCYATGGTLNTCYTAVQGSDANAYDPGKFAGYGQLGVARGQGNESFHVAKSPDDEIKFYGASYAYDGSAWSYYTTREVSTAACPEIAQAVAFEGCISRDVVYYSTGTKVYNAIIGPGAASGSLAFTAPANEQITCMKVYHDAWFNQSVDPETTDIRTSMHDNMLLVATYNPSTGEGTLRAMPISGASGSLTAADADHTFTGFGKITALAIQGHQ